MNTLSLKRINDSAPYTVTGGEAIGAFRFFSEKGVHYAVDFVPDELIETGDSYQLIIANLNNVKSPRDTKVRDSILAIVDEFFNKNNPPCCISVKRVMESKVCVAACLNIGSRPIDIKPYSLC